LLFASCDVFLQGKVVNVFYFTTFVIEYFLFIVQMLLSFLSEPKSPYDYFREDDREPCPEESSNFFSRITWFWLDGLIWKGYRKALTYDDLYDLNYEEKSRVVAPKFQKEWDKEIKRTGLNSLREPIRNEVDVRPRRRGRGPSLVYSLCRAYGFTLFVAGFFKLGNDLLSFVSPQLLKLMIAYVNDGEEAAWKGYAYAALMFLAAVIQSLWLHQYFHRCFVVGVRVRSGVIASVYRKALTLSNKSRRTKTVGEIVNLMSVDAQRFMDLVTYIHMLWSAPLQIVLALVFLYMSMGPSIFAGFIVMILLIPLNALMAFISQKFQVKQMIKKDARIKLVNEVLNGIKVIKLYAWEIPFKRLIMGVRQEEINVLRASAYLNAGFSFTWTCAPFMVKLYIFSMFTFSACPAPIQVALATFAVYSLIPGNVLTADKAFVALSLFNILRFPLSMLPMLISSLVEASVSVKRLGEFLKGEELDSDSVNRMDDSAGSES
jgi:ABC-type multidrug transport system fused ATPase/permease subunit